MPFREFGKNDLFFNQVKAFPKSEFVIHGSRVYYNGFKNADTQTGKFNDILAVPQGFISLYELNVDRQIDKGTGEPPSGKSIYPFITKDGTRISFKTVSTSEFDTTSQFAYGDVIKGDYPLTSSIKRIRLNETVSSAVDISTSERFHGTFTKLTSNKKFVVSLRNTFNEYKHMSHHFSFDDSTNPLKHPDNPTGRSGWDKGKQQMSLIEIPSIFYGSSIKKGSMILQMYITGTLAAECRDVRRNGELIQVSGTYNATKHNNKVAGVILYNEGFIAMTGSWDLSEATETYGGSSRQPKWTDFAEGANDGGTPASEDPGRATLEGVAFRILFEGVSFVPTVTMFAHCPKGEFNNSTNPTAFSSSISKDPAFNQKLYREYEDLEFASLEHSDYTATGSFKKQTYISKIGIYDEQKRLIGIAKLANPVRKTEDREYTFKLKLDF